MTLEELKNAQTIGLKVGANELGSSQIWSRIS